MKPRSFLPHTIRKLVFAQHRLPRGVTIDIVLIVLKQLNLNLPVPFGREKAEIAGPGIGIHDLAPLRRHVAQILLVDDRIRARSLVDEGNAFRASVVMGAAEVTLTRRRQSFETAIGVLHDDGFDRFGVASIRRNPTGPPKSII